MAVKNQPPQKKLRFSSMAARRVATPSGVILYLLANHEIIAKKWGIDVDAELAFTHKAAV